MTPCMPVRTSGSARRHAVMRAPPCAGQPGSRPRRRPSGAPVRRQLGNVQHRAGDPGVRHAAGARRGRAPLPGGAAAACPAGRPRDPAAAAHAAAVEGRCAARPPRPMPPLALPCPALPRRCCRAGCLAGQRWRRTGALPGERLRGLRPGKLPACLAVARSVCPPARSPRRASSAARPDRLPKGGHVHALAQRQGGPRPCAPPTRSAGRRRAAGAGPSRVPVQRRARRHAGNSGAGQAHARAGAAALHAAHVRGAAVGRGGPR